MPLNEEQRKTLDLGVRKMIEAGASEEEVMAYAKDFNRKFETHTPPPVKKKTFRHLLREMVLRFRGNLVYTTR